MKNDKLVKVLSLRLTEQHYHESTGWKKYVEPNTSWIMEKTEVTEKEAPQK